MEKILLISTAPSLQDRLTDLLGSPRFVSRISSWAEALRVLSSTRPLAVVVGPELVDPSQVSQIVGLNNLLQDHQRSCFVLVRPDDQSGGEWLNMFESVALVAPLPSAPGPWADFISPLQALLRATDTKNTAPKKDQPNKRPSEFIIRLPSITKGELTTISLARILYSLHIHRATGLLQLQLNTVKRTVAFLNGELVASPRSDSPDALLGAFAWADGSFHFQPQNISATAKTPIFSLIYQGLSRHRPQRLIMDALMPMMATFPASTQLRRQRKKLVDSPILERFLDACDGKTSLEAILSTMGRDVTAAFQAALFASDTDLIIFHSTPAQSTIDVQYQLDEKKKNTPTTTQHQPDQTRPDLTEQLKSEKKLRTLYNSMKTMSPYEIFGVWEGCGREVVKETFYSMVKEHHPDALGGNVSNTIKDLAQKNFILIRRAYSQLMTLEDEQTVAAPDHAASQRQTPKRSERTTLLPNQVSTPAQARSDSTPIEMGRTPTGRHPDLASRGYGSTSNSHHQPPRRSISQAGLAGPSSDPEWRREQMERLERKPSRPIRRPTPISHHQGSIPPATDPAQDAFNTGYQLFKQQLIDDALPHLENAHNKEPENSLYMTFYAFCLFQSDPAQAPTSKKLLQKAIASNHPQALADAHLFLGLILKISDQEHHAFKHFQKALELNPASRDAEREIRLYHMRYGKKGKQGPQKKSFFQKLFKRESD